MKYIKIISEKIRKILAILNYLFLIVVGIIMLISVFVLIPYAIASKSLTGIIFYIYGLFCYTIILLITIELIVGVFGDLYNFKRKTILFSPNFKDGTPKPDGEKPTVGIKLFVVLLSYIFIIHTYAITYLFIGNYIPKSFDKDNIEWIDTLFLSFTTISVGPSGMEPNSILTKVLVMSEIFCGLIYTIFVFSIIILYTNKQEILENK